MKGVIVHGVLALAGLVLAYLVWVTPEEERPAESVELVDCAPDAVSSLVLDTGDRVIRLEARGEGDERAYWVTVRRRPHEDEEGHREGEGTTRSFVANQDRVEEYLPKVAPLVALRSLGELDEETAKEVELGDDEAGSLDYTCGDQETSYRLGATAFGTGDRYLQDDDGKTYLLGADAIRDLQSAEALLMQRQLHDFEWPDVEGLVLRVEDHERHLLQRNRHDPRRAEWVDAEQPDRRNELFGNWIDRLARLRVQGYLDLDAEPGSDVEGESVEPVPVLDIRFTEGDDEMGHMEMARVDTQPPRYYARTDATRAWVTVPRSIAQQVEDDARQVVGLEPIERPEPETPPAPETPETHETHETPPAAPASPHATPETPPTAPPDSHATGGPPAH